MDKVILDDTENRDNIGNQIKFSFEKEPNCNIVSAYVSDSVIFNDVNNIKSLKLICNARSPSTNPRVLRNLLINTGIDIRSRRDIHAKVYLFKDKAIIGSANATRNGLGVGTIEAASLTESKDIIQELSNWFNTLWENSESEDIRGFTENEWDTLQSAGI